MRYSQFSHDGANGLTERGSGAIAGDVTANAVVVNDYGCRTVSGTPGGSGCNVTAA